MSTTLLEWYGLVVTECAKAGGPKLQIDTAGSYALLDAKEARRLARVLARWAEKQTKKRLRKVER